MSKLCDIYCGVTMTTKAQSTWCLTCLVPNYNKLNNYGIQIVYC